jgi:hypothetical protein
MFLPIIHSLQQGEEGYEQCLRYNALIADKPRRVNQSLMEHIHNIARWKDQCRDALNDAKRAVGIPDVQP